MRKRISYTVLFCLIFAVSLCLWTVDAFGIPTLQLNFPDPDNLDANPNETNPNAIYDYDTESWLLISDNFYIDIVGAQSPGKIDYIEDVFLYIAVPNGESGTVTVQVEEGTPHPVDFSDFGVPPGLNPHGIYPTNYATVSLGRNLIVDGSTGILVKDYIPGGGDSTDVGDFGRFHIEYDGFSLLHFDATGVGVTASGQEYFRFAPYSHDADTPPIPEPSTILLMVGGLFGTGAYAIARFGRKKKRAL